MIGALRGNLIDRDTEGIVTIDVAGVGYDVQVTPPTSVSLGELGSEVALRIHTRVREDSITLYGFKTADEKRCFDALIATHGVGPAVALALLSVYSPPHLKQIIASEDADALSQVPGIGKKTAARMLVELKSKFELDFETTTVDLANLTATGAAITARSDVTTALLGLGYGQDEIRGVLSSLPSDGKAEDMLRLALRELAQSSKVTTEGVPA